jgi:hypothetical protein
VPRSAARRPAGARRALPLLAAALLAGACTSVPTPPPTAAPNPTPLVAATSVAPLASSPTAATGAQSAPTAAAPAQDALRATYTFPDIPQAQFQNAVLQGSVANDRKLLVGAIGSDLWHASSDPKDEFWMVTDRGPNGQVAVDGRNRRTFPIPEFDPVSLRVRLSGSTFTALQTIPIVGQSGKPVTGLSNLEGYDEVPYDYSAQTVLSYNPNGLDTEGLVRTSAGDFWLVEEYGPSLLRVDRAGKVVKRYIPSGLKLSGTDYPLVDTLPAIFTKRKINRGFEGLALSKDEKTLNIVLQSPLSNPNAATGDPARNTRILAFDIATEKLTAEYLYRFEVASGFVPNPKIAPADMKISALVALNPTTLLVDERTDDVAKLYLVDLSKATNILGSKWDDLATSPSLEALADPAEGGITALPKALALDLGAFKNIPQKIEGVAVLDANTLAISNDNDSDIGNFDAAGNNVGTGVKSHILVFTLAKPLPL